MNAKTINDKCLIKNFSIKDAEEFFLSINDKKYRAKQLFIWLYEMNIDSFSLMTNFSKPLRSFLNDKFYISPLTLEQRLISKIDGTEKYLFKTRDNLFIESVLIKNEKKDDGRITICLSSQVGCAMGCRFCQTSLLGFKRNLEVAEILDQISQIRRISGLRNNNIVFMGMGEPFMNYDNVLKASEIMNYSFGLHISVRKITISTCGIKHGIEKFMDEKRPFNLAISLNDTLSEKRKKYMPVEKKYPISEISDLLNYKQPSSRNRLTVEYVMRKDNISSDDAKRIKKIFPSNRIILNLIAINSGDHGIEPPTEEEIEAFIKECNIMNLSTIFRKSMGADIKGACGQLSGSIEKGKK
ncbi:MAG: 23S rRNA (adenine(2503)-C(2))-methyltransferase RlmN [Spirochaetota bacterium]|nr:23S rRNA (adenine(2503)-C(2))-methyltransferase RlmN [Spirochaetota bacterium]